MKRNSLLGKGLMRLAAYVVMAFVCADSAWGQMVAPVNPAFKRWQMERRQKADARQSVTNSIRRSLRLLASGEDEGEFGFAPGTFDSSYLSSINVNSQQGVQGGFASRYDLREHSVLTTVKDQNPYGTCWAHATCASLESWLLKSGVGTFDFSENNMANLHGGDWGFDDGGNGDRASAYLLRWSGPVLESEDPYPNCGGSTEKAPSRHVQNVRWIPGRTSYLDNDAIKQAIIDFGATYVTYHHSSSYYKSSTASYYFYGNTSRSSNHAVAIVGWDDDYPASKFAKSPPGNGAFIVRNSWGAYWGEGGYFYVSYYDESFAWKTLYSFSNAEPADNYDSIYEYDPLGLVSSFGYSSSTAWGANMFQATSATKISAVGFYVMAPNTTYTIYVYTGSTAGAPRSGTLATTQSGKSAYAGYVTVPLSSPVSLSARQRFSVVLQLTTPGYNYPLAIEYSYPGYTSDATASSGQSFFSSNGSSWTDFTSWQGSANFCCKAYTKSAPQPVATLTSIAISGVTSLTSGQSAQFSCEATYSDGSKKAVSPTWSIARAGQAYATVSASGLVTAKTVSAQQTVTVQASYTEGGVTKTATWGMYVTIAAPSAPTGVTATQGTEPSCVRVNWTAPNGATEYAVYRATVNNSKNAKYLENVTVPRYNDTSAVPGIDYWYFIKAKNSSGVSGFSAGASGWRKLSPPESVTASDTLLDKVVLEWSEVEGATHYRVYRATSMDGVKTALGSGWQTATTFNDTTATAGVTYYYFVVAAVNASGSRPSDYSVVEDGMRAKTVTIDRLELKGDATINAGAHADYTADAIYSDGHKVSNITPGSWEIVGDGATVLGGRVSAATVTENKTVVLKATYTEGGRTVRGEKQIAIAAVKPVAPRNVAVTAEAQGVTLTWSAVAGAASYAIYRDGVVVGRVIPNAPDAPATTYTDNTAVPGVTYAYCVAAANGAGEGPQSSPAVTAAIPLPAPADVTATSDRTDGVLVDWRRVMDNAPYQSGTYYFRVSRATSATGAKTDLGSWQTGTSYLDTSATAGTMYWYFVRAATSSGGANASGYSASAQGVRKVPVTLSSISISGPDKVSASKTAMYTCTATYSDGTSKSVSPAWSVSGAATMDANGKLTANAVAANSTATVTASFTDGTTKTANKAVTVIATIRATAEVRNINVASRWPFSSLLDIDYELVTDPASAKAMVSVIGRDEDHNVDMAAKTLSGDGANGSYIPAGQHRLTWNIGADYTNFHAKAFSVTMTATPSIIGVPENVTVSASTSGVTLNWSVVEDATGYEVWRGTGTTTNGATRIATVTGTTTYFDGTGTAGTTYRYWLRACSEDGYGEFAQPVTGMREAAVHDKVQLWEGGPYWATTNIGANEPWEYGYYFWWGDTVGYTRSGGAWMDYGYGDGSGSYTGVIWVSSTGEQMSASPFSSSSCPTYGKDNSALLSAGYIDSTGNLVAAHDAATANLGSPWRIPMDAEFAALIDNCTITWITTNGVYGRLVTGKGAYASRSIFLPAAGIGIDSMLEYSGGPGGYVWSSTPYSDTRYSDNLYFDSFGTVRSYGSRFYGQSVRPVQGGTMYTVTYEPGTNGSGSRQTAIKAHGAALTLKGAIFTRSGYTQMGWSTSDGGSRAYDIGASYTSNAAITLYPYWVVNSRSVQLWANGPYWAMCNVGASRPEEYGYYFWWGDTVGYTNTGSGWISVKDGTSISLTSSGKAAATYGKNNSQLLSAGYIDSTGNLVAAHDAATVHLGSPWRMPTDAEFSALINNCTHTWTTINGVYGQLVTGKGDYADRSIFLPAGGIGYTSDLRAVGSDSEYWSSTPTDSSDFARELSSWSSYFSRNYNNRYRGLSVRPVQGGTTYTVTYKPGANGSGAQQTATKTHDAALTLKGAIFTRSGYTQLGWSTSDGGSKVYDFGASYTSNAAITLYPYWVANPDTGNGVQLWENGPYWATANVGASEPWECGYYFWWGDTVGYTRSGGTLNNSNYSGVTWVSSTGQQMSTSPFSSSCPTYGKDNSALLSAGYIDSTGNLVAAHDAAAAHFGSPWRMPTDAEVSALIDNCTTAWITTNGVKGRLVTGKGDYANRSIFLPAAGEGNGSYLSLFGVGGCYWSSTPGSELSGNAWYIYFNSSYLGRSCGSNFYRYYGYPVRPVQSYIAGSGPMYTVTFDKQSGSGGTASVTATYGSAMPAITVPTRSGYTFGGYYTGTNGSGTQYYTASGASAHSWNLTSATTLYAKWTANITLQEAVDASGLTFTTGGNADWSATADESHLGGSCAKSGVITDSQSTWMQTEVSGVGTISFWYKVSSESNYDKLFFYIDGVQKMNVSGTSSGWTQVEYNVTNNAQHVLKWTYSKDSSVSSGSDCAWVDTVAWTPSASANSLYCVIDLSGGANASSYPVTTMSSAPSGGWTDEYKTTKLVLRKIPAGTYKMQNSADVTLTKPFYMGVFEVTQRQWELVMGTKPSYFSNASYYAARPVERVSYDMIRGSSSGAGWPGSSAVDSSSFIGKIRAKTGIDEFDLPTEAQWEYACRAGTTTHYNSGKNYTGSNCANMNEVGRYYYNGVQNNNGSCDLSAGTAKVGSYLANAWGLYDMHGNVIEWCLDWSGTLSYGTDPVGSSSGSHRVLRGGGWYSYAGGCTSSSQYEEAPSFKSDILGFRLSRTLSNQEDDSHDKVQLWEGGPYWATTNIGAENPEDSGYYFWWGDTVGYKRVNDKWVSSNGSSSNFSFVIPPTYNKSDATLQSEGWITADGVLAPAHDAAHVHWGGNWRMPTKQELDNLNSNCDWTWTTQNGVNGYIVRGRGNYASNSIFLPCVGIGEGTSLNDAGSEGNYWSSVPYSGSSGSAWHFLFYSRGHDVSFSGRDYGRSVRPVQGFTN